LKKGTPLLFLNNIEVVLIVILEGREKQIESLDR